MSEVFPYRLEHVLTDNGSEFMKHFSEHPQEVNELIVNFVKKS